VNEETAREVGSNRTKQEGSAAPEQSAAAPHTEPQNARNLAPGREPIPWGKVLEPDADPLPWPPGQLPRFQQPAAPQIVSGSVAGGDLQIRPACVPEPIVSEVVRRTFLTWWGDSPWRTRANPTVREFVIAQDAFVSGMLLMSEVARKP
jgi:hypothetical protein